MFDGRLAVKAGEYRDVVLDSVTKQNKALNYKQNTGNKGRAEGGDVAMPGVTRRFKRSIGVSPKAAGSRAADTQTLMRVSHVSRLYDLV
jgi:hypothetical protein